MNDTNKIKLSAMLERHEARRTTIYDDATGLPLKPGMTLKGWPTIGVGRNLADPGLSQLEIDDLLRNDIGTRLVSLAEKLSFFKTLDEVRQAALVDMSFMGVAKLLGFHNMLDAIEKKDWPRASQEALESVWAKQVGGRAKEVAAMLLTGVWQN